MKTLSLQTRQSIYALILVVALVAVAGFLVNQKAILFSITNYDDVMKMRETRIAIDARSRKDNNEAIELGLATAVVEASRSSFVSPLPEYVLTK